MAWGAASGAVIWRAPAANRNRIPRISGTASRSQRLGITPRGMSEIPGGDQRMALPVSARFAPAPDGSSCGACFAPACTPRRMGCQRGGDENRDRLWICYEKELEEG